MNEIYEFRVSEEYASLLFGPTEGERLSSGLVRKIKLRADDRRLARVAELQAELTAVKDYFFSGWRITRRYSKQEIDAAELFQLTSARRFEPEGEDCGTLYDDSSACSLCGAGAPRMGPLILSARSFPKNVDIACSIAGELIISRRLAEILLRENVTGIASARLFSRGKPLSECADWRDPQFLCCDADVSPATHVGDPPFDFTPQPCPNGDLLGLNLVSEVSISRCSRGSCDVIVTRQFVGTRRGVLRPRRLILVSPRVRSLFLAEKVRGCEFERAHVIG